MTKSFLEEFGVCSSIWGHHSTRGASVWCCVFKKNWVIGRRGGGEIGKWESVKTFCANYQRSVSQDNPQNTLRNMLAVVVHSKTSHRRSAELEGSRTPPENTRRGRKGHRERRKKPMSDHPAHPQKGALTTRGGGAPFKKRRGPLLFRIQIPN